MAVASFTVDLDRSFRKGSAARLAAERLLTGQPHTRRELMGGTGVSLTTVNRVVEELARAGANVERSRRGREAVFTLVSVGKPHHLWPAIDDPAQIVGAFLVAGQTVIDVEVTGRIYRGQLLARSERPELGQGGVVRGIQVDDDDTGVALTIRTDGGAVHIGAAHVQTPT